MTETSQVITLRGSADIVTEFFNFSVNTILYQRGLYPPESFRKIPKYGLSCLLTTDSALNAYLEKIMKQLNDWLVEGAVKKLILVVKGIETGNTLERWVFDCECNVGNTNGKEKKSSKALREVHNEIAAIIRQITASVTFLPLLNEECAFDLLVYADKEAAVPLQWEDSDPCFIANSEDVKFRSFSTQLHKVDVRVSYRVEEDF